MSVDELIHPKFPDLTVSFGVEHLTVGWRIDFEVRRLVPATPLVATGLLQMPGSQVFFDPGGDAALKNDQRFWWWILDEAVRQGFRQVGG